MYKKARLLKLKFADTSEIWGAWLQNQNHCVRLLIEWKVYFIIITTHISYNKINIKRTDKRYSLNRQLPFISNIFLAHCFIAQFWNFKITLNNTKNVWQRILVQPLIFFSYYFMVKIHFFLIFLLTFKQFLSKYSSKLMLGLIKFNCNYSRFH